MRFFYDTEFMERGSRRPIKLISIGIVAEDGRELLAANADFSPSETDNPFLLDHVVPFLPPPDSPAWKPQERIREDIQAFVGNAVPEWWAYFSDYDHVVLSQIFGDMTALPENWPKFTCDIEQLRITLGSPQLPVATRPHDALADAHFAKLSWEFLREHSLSLAERLIREFFPEAEAQARVRAQRALMHVFFPDT